MNPSYDFEFQTRAVKIYNATSSLVRLEYNKNIIFTMNKRSSLLHRWRSRCKFQFLAPNFRWKSDIPLTNGQLQSKRDEFWDTAPAFEGKQEIW
jgi:hypothetical protein